MKKIAFPLLLACLQFCAFSQNVDWFKPSNKWYFQIQSGWVGSGIEKMGLLSADSTVNGIAYRKMASTAEFSPTGVKHEYLRLVRQDGPKIFTITPFSGEEIKLYDFTLAVGDTVWLPIDPWAGKFGYLITKLENIQISGQNRLVQEVEWMPGNTYLNAKKGRFVEGIGNVEGLHIIAGEWCLAESYFFLDEPGNLVVDGEVRHFCSFSNDEITFEGLGATLCKSLATGSAEVEKVQILPNPSTGAFQILGENGQKILGADLFDLTGRLIERLSVGASGEVFTEKKGLVILVVRTENGLIRQKLVLL